MRFAPSGDRREGVGRSGNIDCLLLLPFPPFFPICYRHVSKDTRGLEVFELSAPCRAMDDLLHGLSTALTEDISIQKCIVTIFFS